MRPDPLTRLRERRLLARALSVAAHTLAAWPIEDTATADAMLAILHRDYRDLEDAFPAHGDVWEEGLQRQLGEDQAPLTPVRPLISILQQPYRIEIDDYADAIPF